MVRLRLGVMDFDLDQTERISHRPYEERSVITSPDRSGYEGAGGGTECAASGGSKHRRRDIASGYMKPTSGALIIA